MDAMPTTLFYPRVWTARLIRTLLLVSVALSFGARASIDAITPSNTLVNAKAGVPFNLNYNYTEQGESSATMYVCPAFAMPGLSAGGVFSDATPVFVQCLIPGFPLLATPAAINLSNSAAPGSVLQAVTLSGVDLNNIIAMSSYYTEFYLAREWQVLGLTTQYTVTRVMMNRDISTTNDALSVAPGGVATVTANDTVADIFATYSPVAMQATMTILGNGGLTGLSVVPDVTGPALLVPPAATPGIYVVTYQICDAFPGGGANCANGTATLTVTALPVLVASADAVSFPRLVGGTLPVLANDTIDAAPATAANVAVTITIPGALAGLTVNGAGAIVVPAAAVGVYPVTYQICAISSPATCTTAVATITLAPALVATADAAPFPTTGGTMTVLANDTVDGAAATTITASVNIIANGGVVGLSVNGAGALVVPAFAAGVYPATYRICSVPLPAVCSGTVGATITITPAPAVAANADTIILPSTGGVANVITNDTIGAAPATAANSILTIVASGGLVGVSVTAGNMLSVPANPPGGYALIYRLCDALSPLVCANATANIAINPPAVAAAAITTALPNTGGTINTLASVTIDGVAASTTTATITLVSAGTVTGATVNAAGALVIPAQTPGSYTMQYRACAVSAPATCATGTITLTISPATVLANADTITLPNTGGVASVITNDTIGAAPATAANSILTIVAPGGLVGVSVAAGNMLSVPANPPGIYSLIYRLCDALSPLVCANATANITINAPGVAAAAITTALPSAGGTINTMASVTINGVAASTTTATITLVSAGTVTGATVNAAGALVIPAQTPGSYTMQYRACAVSAPATCATGNITLAISPPTVLANADTFTIPDAGGVLNVLANDVVAGVAANSANAITTVVSAVGLTGLTVNANGAIVVPAAAGGQYTVTYRICAVSAPASCATGTVTVNVSVTALTFKLIDDFVTANATGATFNVLTNDLLAGRAIAAANVVLSIVNNGRITALVIDANGVLTIPPTSFGVYDAVYRVCQKGLPSNCADAKVRITVTQIQGGSGGTSRTPPSVPGTFGATRSTLAGNNAPMIFSQAVPSTAGAANSPLILGVTRLGYGLNAVGTNFQSYRTSSDFEPFGAQFQYSGSGLVSYRWEVVQPGDPEPTPFDLLPQASLSIQDQVKQARYTEIARGEVYLPVFGRHFLRGPDPTLLPRNGEGIYRILLRIEANAASSGGAISGASPFPIAPLTYVMGGVNGIETPASSDRKKRGLTGGTGVAEFSSMGLLPDGGPALGGGSLKYRPVGDAWKTLALKPVEIVGAVTQPDQSVELIWKAFEGAASYLVEVEPLSPGFAGVSAVRIIGVVKTGGSLTFLLRPSALANFEANKSLRWRVVVYASDRKIVGQSDWQPLRR